MALAELSLRALLGLLNLSRRLVRRPSLASTELLFGELVRMLVTGNRMPRDSP